MRWMTRCSEQQRVGEGAQSTWARSDGAQSTWA
eukprot:CAMPEP_0174750910 /NCGR_PEP_ID=MMETSP1094-20130205/98734_1 /TAXON_ID=156173 /ORGANISM="Chrysochromulina brevifilum, Strain UTEX LB 985" /LENGTH=32 /DNA_ID= /DNA_START= /DNA_END= /DNA_ORIENTATION=